ncbi:ABC transporter [Agarivorans sp. B2Z047]|uniref:ABC transporter permease n=1 Tax=Agarivorans sp. B2Z047 TaxID=2652721 RepID=UPI00128DD4E7|nr:ABC transporter permease [Agarivorans sp. B2Z047]MPW28750.1 ABC transporter [Agarivorans sp. B2Z047]UQN41311.1 ABC transporter permease [Agarivorans sp. B2Z047]
MATVTKRSRLAVWKDVIFALFVREIRSRFSDKIGISWALIEPVSFIFLLSFIRGRLNGGEIHTMPTFAFMMYGMLLVQLFLTAFSSSSNAISKNKSLYAFRQVQPISSIIAISFFELLVKLGVALCIYVIMYLMGIDIRVDNPLMLLVCAVLLWLTAVSIGLVFGVMKCFVKEVGKVQGVLTRPLFFISGVFFSLQDMPKEYWKYFDWNPILHAIELSRQSAYNSFGAKGVSINFLLMITLITFTFSLSIYHASWKRAISR